jgi:Sulfotransferase domain
VVPPVLPAPRQKNGRRTITGEGTPSYLFHPLAAERMAGVIPEAKLIALLRNPVDRTYSAYHHRAKHREEIRPFEETVEASFDAPNQGFLSQSIYVDHLLRWSRFFDREQMLVLKSEDFFERPREILKLVLDFLDLPDWEPEASELRDRVNKGGYEQRMDPATRRRLEEYFEPHNQRLYEFLGVDFGW